MKISVIGVGAMGGALVEGLLQIPEINPSDITVSDPSEKAVNRFAHSGVSLSTDNGAAALGADIVVVVVKPWLVEQVLTNMRDALNLKEQIIIIIAAGVPSSSIKEWLDQDNGIKPRLFLAIPNTAIAVRESMTFVVPVDASPEDTRTIADLFDRIQGKGSRANSASDRQGGSITPASNWRAPRSSSGQSDHSWRSNHQRTQRNGTCRFHLCRNQGTESRHETITNNLYKPWTSN